MQPSPNAQNAISGADSDANTALIPSPPEMQS